MKTTFEEKAGLNKPNMAKESILVYKGGEKMQKGELIAKLKFWFGKEHNIFNEKDFLIEIREDGFCYVYKKLRGR